MLISIVIPTYKRNDLLQQCLQNLYISLQKVDSSLYEVIITDDSPVGEARQLVETEFPWANWLQGPKRGPAANRNFGAGKAIGEWLLFTDDDCLPQSEWMPSYINALQQSTDLILEGKTVADRPRMRFDEVAPLNLTGKKLWSCNFAIKKAYFEQVGGFDESFPHSTMEDIDFYVRAAKGATIKFVPDALVVHPWRRRVGFKHFFKRLKSQQYYAMKHGIKGTFKFRWQRFKIFAGSIFTNLAQLARFSMRGWYAYLDKCVFDFFMIFI